MGIVKNYNQLAITPQRKIVLDLVETALDSIRPEKVIPQKITVHENHLKIEGIDLNLAEFGKVIVLGFGKGSARNARILEDLLGNAISEGYVIDTSGEQQFQKIEFSEGTHPLPSVANIDFTKKVVKNLSNLTERDLVLIITCGGGSVMFESPRNLTLDQMVDINKSLLHSGATIQEMNVVRKHIDIVKGGGLAQILYPAKVINLVFSDVPGNDLSTIASGPVVLDTTTKEDAMAVIKKYNLGGKLAFAQEGFSENPKDEKYFKNVKNILVLTSETALNAMEQKAKEMGINAKIYAANFQSSAELAGKILIDETKPRTILLTGGETDVKVTGSGKGGRNQHLVTAALPYLDEHTVICSFDSDGWDNTEAAGAIADKITREEAKKLNLDPQSFLENNDSFTFTSRVGDAILTGRLPSNVSDLIIVYKNKLPMTKNPRP